MKNRKNILFAIFLVMIIIAIPSSLMSQSKTGTTIGQFLKIEPGSRFVAMGNAGVSLKGEASSIYYNPASVGSLTGYDVQFTYNEWIADIAVNYAAAAVNFEGLGTFSLQITSLSSGEIDVRTVDQPLGTGEKYTVSNFALGLGYGLMLTDRVSVGLVVNYVNESIWHSSISTFGFNFGVQYSFLDNDLTLGASVSNFSAAAKYEGRDLFLDYDFNHKTYGDNDQLPGEFRTDSYTLPTTFRAGASYNLKFTEELALLIAADAIHPNDNNESINTGAELQIGKNFFVRGGFRNLFLEDREGGLMLGAGVAVPLYGQYKIRFDYAWSDYGRLLKTHRFTLGIGFN